MENQVKNGQVENGQVENGQAVLTRLRWNVAAFVVVASLTCVVLNAFNEVWFVRRPLS